MRFGKLTTNSSARSGSASRVTPRVKTASYDDSDDEKARERRMVTKDSLRDMPLSEKMEEERDFAYFKGKFTEKQKELKLQLREFGGIVERFQTDQDALNTSMRTQQSLG